MIKFNGKDYTNYIGDYVKDLEEAFQCADRERGLLSEKYTSILIAFKTLLDDAKEL